MIQNNKAPHKTKHTIAFDSAYHHLSHTKGIREPGSGKFLGTARAAGDQQLNCLEASKQPRSVQLHWLGDKIGQNEYPSVISIMTWTNLESILRYHSTLYGTVDLLALPYRAMAH